METYVCRSEMCRTIKLFLVGKAMRGKSSLLRRLCNYSDKKTATTVGIDIDSFSYPKTTRFGKGKEPVQFLVWDFAGEVCIVCVCVCVCVCVRVCVCA